MILWVIKRLLCNLDKNGLIFNDQIEKRPNEVLPLVTFMRLNLEWLSALLIVKVFANLVWLCILWEITIPLSSIPPIVQYAVRAGLYVRRTYNTLTLYNLDLYLLLKNVALKTPNLLSCTTHISHSIKNFIPIC